MACRWTILLRGWQSPSDRAVSHVRPVIFSKPGRPGRTKNLLTGVIEISAHNHGFTVTPDSDLHGAEITHVNLNDHTVEGLRHVGLGAFSVQYHPEASPGPHDSLYLFDEFVDRVKGEVPSTIGSS